MPRRQSFRWLVVGPERFRWSLAHDHDTENDAQGRRRYVRCREMVRIRRAGTPGGFDIVFQAGAGRFVSDGYSASGAVWCADGRGLNLHEPGTARALLDEAIAGGWQPSAPVPAEIDGWTLFDAVAARRVPPGD